MVETRRDEPRGIHLIGQTYQFTRRLLGPQTIMDGPYFLHNLLKCSTGFLPSTSTDDMVDAQVGLRALVPLTNVTPRPGEVGTNVSTPYLMVVWRVWTLDSAASRAIQSGPKISHHP